MKRLSFAALAALVCLCHTARAADEQKLVIGNWNIEWLGLPNKRESKVKQEAAGLAEYILETKVDILGLNEITDDDKVADTHTNTTITEALKKIKEKTGQEWQHVLFVKEDPKELDQLCGVAWNTTKVTMEDKPWRVPVRRTKESDFWRRHPYAVKFSAGEKKTDIVVIAVHMKSNYGGQEKAIPQRADEAKALVQTLGAIQSHFSDDDVVIVGDFNTLKGSEVALDNYRWGGWRDLNKDDAKTWIKNKTYDYAPFDRILVPEKQPEFKASQMKVWKKGNEDDEKKFRAALSDHYMVTAEVLITEDDD